MGRVDGFEQRVVLRMSRFLYLSMAGFATVGLCGGIATLGWGMSPTLDPSVPAEVPLPETPVVTVEEVLAALNMASDEAENEAMEDEALGAAEVAAGVQPDGEWRMLVASFTALFDDGRYPWKSKQEQYCSLPGWGRCYQWESRILARGVVDVVSSAVEKMPDGQRTALLRSLVDTVSLVGIGLDPVARDDLRFVAVGTVVDLALANGQPDPVVTTALMSALNPAGSENGLAPEVARPVLRGIAKARKKGTDPATQAVFIAATPDLVSLFPAPDPADQKAPDLRVLGLAAVWEAMRDALPALAPGRLAAIRAITEAAPVDQRIPTIETWSRLVAEKATRSQLEYQQAVEARADALAEEQAAAEALRIEKSAMAVSATGAIGTALASIAVLGLFLALLGVERNTRALQEVLARADKPRVA